MNNIEIRPLTTMDELIEMQKVEESVWHADSIPVHQTFTALNNGGIIIGAFDHGKMVGFLYSFAGFDGKRAYLCSHELGILPAYQKSGLGERMKWMQADLAFEAGYEMLTWTFDPLESVNAYLNLHKLGAEGVFYKANYYGVMEDELNQGLPSDRIHIKWEINHPTTTKDFSIQQSQVLLVKGPDGSPQITDAFDTLGGLSETVWFMAFPEDFQTLKSENIELAKSWRLATRTIFEAMFANGYKAVDIIRDQAKKQSFYVLKK
ncbi:GNAT family N-acetyltransferase [Oceanobacillus chungangensis]|uniref:GNAT family N-acetyltransferase n=1 Tax=Oceanobacillus chungangensis TaxID=1229152 RepID=A0A3D8PUV6_9BACI|nr:GNAT family N-acetyltransferase [Oceanobacillus chungangensis]RDW19794.1 GNAT family N-acetyltransferase [Oceanobacillus chungangensis]